MVQEQITLTAEERRDLCVLNCKLYTTLTGEPVRPQDFEAMFEAKPEHLISYNMLLMIALCQKEA